MFGYESLIEIRNLELFLYDGPETVEQIYDVNDRFISAHPRRRHHKDNCAQCHEINDNIWYSYRVNVETNSIEYNVNPTEEK